MQTDEQHAKLLAQALVAALHARQGTPKSPPKDRSRRGLSPLAQHELDRRMRTRAKDDFDWNDFWSAVRTPVDATGGLVHRAMFSEEHDAVTLVSRLWRGRKARANRELEMWAAEYLQRFIRGKQRKWAARKIQARVRGRQTRRWAIYVRRQDRAYAHREKQYEACMEMAANLVKAGDLSTARTLYNSAAACTGGISLEPRIQAAIMSLDLGDTARALVEFEDLLHQSGEADECGDGSRRGWRWVETRVAMGRDEGGDGSR